MWSLKSLISDKLDAAALIEMRIFKTVIDELDKMKKPTIENVEEETKRRI